MSKKISKIKGTVVLVKSNVLGLNDYVDSFLDGIHELIGNGVTFELVSATVGDPSKGNRGKLGKPAILEKWLTTGTLLAAGDSSFRLSFEWDEKLGVPGAVIVKNNHHAEFFLKTLTLENVPGPRSRIHFVCNSWVYPVVTYTYDRIFFANDTYLPGRMPEPLKAFRAEELENLRGDGVNRPLMEGDRVYNYDYYNDLGDPDKGAEFARPILGGSEEYPYPRRGRTGRAPTKTDAKSESRLPLVKSLDVYVPRDERFGHLKMSDFLAFNLKLIAQLIAPALDAAADQTPFEFDSFQDVWDLYEGGIKLPDHPAFEEIRNQVPFEFIRELLRRDGEHLFRLPTPDLIKADKFAWRTDEEFGRETLAGMNPVIIRLLTKFPPVSNLDPSVYGNQNSTMTADKLEKNMNGLTVDKAIKRKKLFILDHHDAIMPYVERINSTNNKIYASRTVFILQDDGTLKPLAIELSLPAKGEKGAASKVYTPAEHGVEGAVWQLAKAYASVNDAGVHQLISHWLNTHATVEPFVIATNRQLSAVHPIYKLLSPHFRDTMNINALARQILINAGGLVEKNIFPDKYAMELSSAIYKNWKLTDLALPVDLLNRGVAEEDKSRPGKLRLVIADYPYAVDGLAVWSAIEEWVKDYSAIYYSSDETVQEDAELQSWWKEIREVGHGDKKNETWWPSMQSLADLTQTCTTIIWVASALHAAVNFGQYAYGSLMTHRPTLSRKFMPEPGTKEYADLEADPDRVLFRTITSQLQTMLGDSVLAVLSSQSSDEMYLGQRDTPEWTSEEKALTAFKEFSNRLIGIENRIVEMNRDPLLLNRNGPVKIPYTLLYPSTSDFDGVGGLTGRGIPNSVSI
ncbi:putative linoleate 9S-lipoxygenase 5 [Wolffia australiana]